MSTEVTTAVTNTVTSTVQEPILAVVKAVTNADGVPASGFAFSGDVLTYTGTYTNSGHAPANSVVLIDAIPAGSTYVASSASGAGTTITFSTNAGVSYSASPVGTIDHIKWTLNSAVAASGGTGSVSFKVTVD